MLGPVLKKNKNTKHPTTGIPPTEAKKHSNHMEVWLNISNKATYNRRYPPLKVSDQVRVYQKPKSFKKGYESVWSTKAYTLELIKDGAYLLNDYEKRRIYGRHELLKVDGAEAKAG